MIGTTGTIGTTDASSQTGATDTSETTMPGPVCGDGIVDRGELCDDGNQFVDDGCNNACVRDALFVFVSGLALAPADFATPQMADDICTALAQGGAGVPPVARSSKFVAWLSYDGPGGNAIERVPSSPLPYRVTHSSLTQVFADTAQIPGETNLNESIRYTEGGVEIAGDKLPCTSDAVWTGTDGFGIGTGQNCANWTSNDVSMLATAGRSGAVDNTWTDETSCFCAGALRIYCFEAG
jgi:cysteine-rich repeat protein